MEGGKGEQIMHWLSQHGIIYEVRLWLQLAAANETSSSEQIECMQLDSCVASFRRVFEGDQQELGRPRFRFTIRRILP